MIAENPFAQLGKVCIQASGPSGPKQLGFYHPLNEMLLHRRVTPGIKVGGTHLYTWMERGTATLKYLVQTGLLDPELSATMPPSHNLQ